MTRSAAKIEFYDELNAEQRTAVETIDGPLLVLAGPGTGKTQLLSIRAAKILATKKDVLPENILIVTYTNPAAKAIKERLVKILGKKGYDLEVGTFHSFANSIIQESVEAANYIGDKVQMTDVEQAKAVKYVLDHAKGVSDIRPFRAPYVYLKEIVKRIGELKKDGISPDRFIEYVNALEERKSDVDPKQIGRLKALGIVYKMYETIKEGKVSGIFDERGRYDFDDMILFATEALRKEKDLADEYRRLYRYIMVDEYQDTNEAQLEFLLTLLDYGEPNLCCVGDDDQSIYRFQGASVGNFKVLKDRFPTMRTITLKDNYRSTKELIDFASRIIGAIPADDRAGQKVLWPVRDYRDKNIEFREFTKEAEELSFIVDRIKALSEAIRGSGDLDEEARMRPYNNIAVLVRKRISILKVIDAFLQAGIPYATDGKEDISGEKRVKQLLDILELASLKSDNARERDLAWYKVISADYLSIPLSDILSFINFVNSKRRSKEGIRATSATLVERFLEAFQFDEEDLAAGTSGIDFEEASKKFGILTELAISAPARMTRAAWAISRLLRDAHARPVHAILLTFLNDVDIFRYILETHSSAEVLKIRDLRALTAFINMVKSLDTSNPGIRLEEFIADMKLAKENGLGIRGDLVTMTQDGVRVFTAHGSKGQEFHTVFIPFCLQNKNWPARPRSDMIVLPPGLFKTKSRITDKAASKRLFMQDETRLFYVASTRAKANLIFTASPQEDDVASYYLGALKVASPSGIGESQSEEDLLEKSLIVAEGEKDPYLETKEILRDMVKDMSLNPTSLNNYLTCARKFLYSDVLMLPGAKRQSLVFGNCVHKALEETYKLYMKETRFPPFEFFEDAFKKELRFQGVEEAIETMCLDQMGTLRRWFKRASESPVKPLELEKKLVITVGDGITFAGKFDKVELEDPGGMKVRVVDYKTGKPDDHIKDLESCQDLSSDDCDEYLRQLVAYKMLVEKDKRMSKVYTVSHGELVFIEPITADIRKLNLKKGDFVSKKIAIRKEMADQMEDIIKKAWADITNLRFAKLPARDDKKCRNCDFDGICWA